VNGILNNYNYIHDQYEELQHTDLYKTQDQLNE